MFCVPRARGARTGLTLIEVMLALAILGIGLSVLIASASKCLAVIRQSKNYETARHLLALVEVEEPLLLKEKIEAGSEDGQFTGDYYSYKWSRNIEVVGEEEDGLFSVTTRVSWSERGANPHEEVVEYLYAPEEVEGGTVVGR
jgi:prepilin-type N-terminal cleavage/methylation domain-containing protein